MYFPGFWRNNIAFTLNDHEFERYQLQEKFIFWQLVAKTANFADIKQNNSVFTQKKKKQTRILKLSLMRNHECY